MSVCKKIHFFLLFYISVYGQVVTTSAVTGISAERSYDTGVNFEY